MTTGPADVKVTTAAGGPDGMPLALKLNDGLGCTRPDDAIARCKRILALVDTYAERPDRMNRTALRVALMTEFEEGRTVFTPTERDEAIEREIKARDWPTNPKNAARAGWHAALRAYGIRAA